LAIRELAYPRVVQLPYCIDIAGCTTKRSTLSCCLVAETQNKHGIAVIEGGAKWTERWKEEISYKHAVIWRKPRSREIFIIYYYYRYYIRWYTKYTKQTKYERVIRIYIRLYSTIPFPMALNDSFPSFPAFGIIPHVWYINWLGLWLV